MKLKNSTNNFIVLIFSILQELYRITKYIYDGSSPSGHPKETSPKGNVFFCEKSQINNPQPNGWGLFLRTAALIYLAGWAGALGLSTGAAGASDAAGAAGASGTAASFCWLAPKPGRLLGLVAGA